MLSYLQWFEIFIVGTNLENCHIDELYDIYDSYLAGKEI